jgi:uncharacterized membrane protein (DUF485 family)
MKSSYTILITAVVFALVTWIGYYTVDVKTPLQSLLILLGAAGLGISTSFIIDSIYIRRQNRQFYRDYRKYMKDSMGIESK